MHIEEVGHAYKTFIHAPTSSPLQIYAMQVYTCPTSSPLQIYAMPGLRIGWLVTLLGVRTQE